MVGVGDILAAKYKVEKSLGKGGMGYVVAARHLQLDQQVAIKILIPELVENQDAVARFLREARSAVRIRSDHVARVLDVGTLDDGTPFMVMELLEGTDLAKEIEARKRLPVSEAVDWLLQVCEGLADAHAVGIVHRDLKPANLFRTTKSDGSNLIKILDFGISKALVPDTGEGAPSITNTQGVMGSPHYMSPEQVRKPRTVDQRSDIWSLGVILHEFLTGTPPFASETPMAILAAVVSDEPPQLRSSRFDVPDGLQSVVSTCLAKDASNRYADVVELALALKPFAPQTGEASFNRISAILRSGRGRASEPKPVMWPSNAPTLESGNAPPTTPDDKPKHTVPGWGSSQAGSRQTRTRLVAMVTAFAAMLAFAAALGYTIRGRGESGEPPVMSNAGSAVSVVPAVPAAPAVPAVAPSPPPAAEPVAIVAQQPEAGATSAAVDSGAAVAVQPPATSKPVVVAAAPAPRPVEKTPAPKRDEKAPALKREDKPPPEAKPSDPLDGRR